MWTSGKNQEFQSTIISGDLLSDAMEWIGLNMNPEDVFSDDDLSAWARDNDFIIEEDNIE